MLGTKRKTFDPAHPGENSSHNLWIRYPHALTHLVKKYERGIKEGETLLKLTLLFLSYKKLK